MPLIDELDLFPAEQQAIHDLDVQSSLLPNGLMLVRVSGEVDIVTAPGLRDRVEQAVRRCADESAAGLVLDLTGVTFLGTAGLSVLLELAENAAGRDLPWAVAAAGRAVLRPLAATGHLETVPVYPEVDAAADVVLTGAG
ncbi:anti-anti-sigma factor [Amycolatopsis arida]|uniref:Anti-sigma factor antagonist n=1 Tax=Amycolatopsis arida TaxID=587909 RepID=A0A1I5L3P3_9PSEU|nr:STAS domain-containing protein [Amycolatopsis arida]TDX93573.1 anti-anti-sigma factor [Amycolatopsis arida]SFO91950.1 anti-anti-sigma factor [Amycolatopsis arida]